MGGGVGFIVFRLLERGGDMGQPENYLRVPYGLLASRVLALKMAGVVGLG